MKKENKKYFDTLIISQNFHPIEGGVQTYMYELAKNWKAGRPYVLCEIKKNEPAYQSKPFEVHRFKNIPVSYFKSIYRIFKILFHKPKEFINAFVFFILLIMNRNILITMIPLTQHLIEILSRTSHPTVIQCSKTLHIGAIGMIGKILYGYPLIIYIHGTELNNYDFKKSINLLYKFIIKKADIVISNSEFTKKLAIAKGGNEKNIKVVNLGANISKFYPQNTKAIICKKHNIEFENTILLTISHLIKRKGHELVLLSLSRIIKINNKVHYIIVGQGEYRKELQKIVIELNLKQYVTFAGYVDDDKIPQYMNACDIFVMPNRQVGNDFEGFGIVYLEANACCKPVIGGNSGGVTDAIINKNTGLLVDPNNVRDLEEKIRLLIDDKELASKLAQNGYERVISELNWEKVILKISRIILGKI
jgi:phosphatidylinositol alpha-1,6-mannosyltransferase